MIRVAIAHMEMLSEAWPFIETAGDHEICRQLGFTCAQGYFYGRPAMPKSLMDQPEARLMQASAQFARPLATAKRRQ